MYSSPHPTYLFNCHSIYFTQLSSQIFSIRLGQILLPQGKDLPPCFTERANQYTVQRINVMISRWRAWEACAAIEMLTRLFHIILFIDLMIQ